MRRPYPVSREAYRGAPCATRTGECHTQQIAAYFRAAAFALAAWAPYAVAVPIDPNNPPSGRFSDEWMEIHMGPGKVGYAHSSMTREGDLVHTDMHFHIRMGRAEQPVTIEMKQHVTETVAGIPKAFTSEVNMAAVKQSIKGLVADGKVEVTTSQFGLDQTQAFDFPAGAVMAWGTYRESLLRGFQPVTEYTLSTYAPEMRLDGAVSAVTRVGDWEEFAHAGNKQRGQKILVSMQSPMGSMEMTSWVNGDGVPIKSIMPVPGMGDFTLLAVDQKAALSDFLPPEFFNTTVVKAKRKIDYQSAQRIKYRVFAKDGKTDLGDLPETDSQKINAKGEHWVELTVSRLRPPAPSRGPSSSSGQGNRVDPAKSPGGKGDASLAEFLDGNLMMNLEDETLKDLAMRARGDGSPEPSELADRLRKFVTEFVQSKNLNVGFATANEVARNREGDCSEHGVLLAALGRLNGIPSRVAVGLAYVPVFGKQDDIFGYHLWTQFHVDGRWIDVDAALRETDCSPIRIAFATSSLKNSVLADLSLPLFTKLGAIDIDVLEIE